MSEDADLVRVKAYRPKCSNSSSSFSEADLYAKPKTSFVVNGASQMEDFIVQALQRLDDGSRADLLQLPLEDIVVGTACSGTDVAVLVAKAFAKAWQRVFHTRLDVIHAFSCEKDEMKQRFLTTMFTDTFDFSEMQMLLGDTSELTKKCDPDEDAVYDLLHGTHRTGLPVVTDLMVGFPCQDVSKLNPAADDARWVVRDAGRRTGKVFEDIADYCNTLMEDKKGKKIFTGLLLENVMGLTIPPKGVNADGEAWHSNLDYCELAMRKAGIFLLAFILDPRMFGIPVSRHRVWMIGLPAWMLEEAGLEEDTVTNMAHDLVDRLCDCSEAPCRDLRDFLLPLDHPVVQRQVQLARGKSEKRSARTTRPVAKAPKWAEQHCRAFEKSGRDWWEPSFPAESVFCEFPGLHALTERQFDLLAVLNVKFPDTRIATVELSQNLRSGKEREIKNNHADIVTPNGQQLVLHQCRCLTGLETLFLQGIHFGPSLQDRVEQMDDSLLRSLGGNAFQGHCCAIMFVVKQALLARLRSAIMVRKKQCQLSEPHAKRLRTVDDFCEWPA